MASYVLIGNVLLRGGLKRDWMVAVEDDVIVLSDALSSKRSLDYLNGISGDKVYNFDKNIIAPAFIDIHCHSGGGVISHEDPRTVMAYHRKNGTGAMLMTMYRTLGHEVTLEGIAKVKEAMKTDKGILGVHLEGPYLNPALGTAVAADVPRPDKTIYGKYLESGVIKMCTFAPELEGTPELCRDLVAAGTVGAMGHSAATYDQVHAAVEAGATVVTHVFNASEKTEGPISYRGTKNLDFDEACMLEDGLYYEVICDRRGIHVRPQMIKLLEKTVGKDRIVGITDCYGYDTVEETGEDVNIDDQGEISGSRMNMTCVARNFLNLGYSLTDVFGFTSYNPAKALGVDNILGEIAEGKRANLIITDEKLSSVRYFEAE